MANPFFQGIMSGVSAPSGLGDLRDDRDAPSDPIAPVADPGSGTIGSTANDSHGGHGGGEAPDLTGYNKAIAEERARQEAIFKQKMAIAQHYSDFQASEANKRNLDSLSQKALDQQVAQERSQWMNPEVVNNADLAKLNYQDAGISQAQKINPWEVDNYLKTAGIDYNTYDFNNPAKKAAIQAPVVSPTPQPGTGSATPINRNGSTPAPATTNSSFSGSFTEQPVQQQAAPQAAPAPAPAPVQQQAPAPAPAQQPYTQTSRSVSGPAFVQQKLSSKSSVAPTTPKAVPETQIKGGVSVPVNTKSGLGF